MIGVCGERGRLAADRAISTYMRSTPVPAVSASPSVLTARAGVAFRDLDEVVSTLLTVTPLTNGPGDVTTSRAT
jgi:hypothetical protein